MDIEKENVFEERFRVAMVKQGNMTLAHLARLLNTSSSNLSKKFKQNNFAERDARTIANKLGYDVKIMLVDKETGEEIK